MTIISKFDEGDIIHCLDLMAQQERWFKCVGIESWGSFNGFRYQVRETDSKGKPLYDDLIETYDDEDFKTQFIVYSTKEQKQSRKVPDDLKECFDNMDKLTKIFNSILNDNPKGDDKK